MLSMHDTNDTWAFLCIGTGLFFGLIMLGFGLATAAQGV